MKHTWIASFSILIILTLAAGCAPLRTYPAVDGTRELPWPGMEPVPSMCRRAISHLRMVLRDDGPLYLNMPEGADGEVYRRVLHLLREGEPMTSPDQPAYHIIQVRARGLQGEVDVLRTEPSESPEFYTVYMERDAMDWRATDRRLWRIPTDVPPPHYQPPDEPTADDTTPAGNAETLPNASNDDSANGGPADEGDEGSEGAGDDGEWTPPLPMTAHPVAAQPHIGART